jgi:hypothetical protein
MKMINRQVTFHLLNGKEQQQLKFFEIVINSNFVTNHSTKSIFHE